MKKSVLLLALLLPLQVSYGGQIKVLGPGAQSCGEWLARRNSGQGWTYQLIWVLGYYTATQDQTALSLKTTDSQAITAFIDGYCAENPFNDLLDAARALIWELKE